MKDKNIIKILIIYTLYYGIAFFVFSTVHNSHINNSITLFIDIIFSLLVSLPITYLIVMLFALYLEIKNKEKIKIAERI
jgi:hypothetical protein